MQTVTIYTTPGCAQCDMTKLALTKRGIEFETVELAQDAEALEKVRSLGYSAAPVVLTNTDHWSGFQPDKIAGIPNY